MEKCLKETYGEGYEDWTLCKDEKCLCSGIFEDVTACFTPEEVAYYCPKLVNF